MSSSAITGRISGLVATSVDRDGDLDFFVANGSISDRNYVLINTGRGLFRLPVPGEPFGVVDEIEVNLDVEFADLDGDGDPDMVLTNVDRNPAKIFFNR